MGEGQAANGRHLSRAHVRERSIGEDAFENALSDGRRMSLEEAVDYAVSIGP